MGKIDPCLKPRLRMELKYLKIKCFLNNKNIFRNWNKFKMILKIMINPIKKNLPSWGLKLSILAKSRSQLT